MRVRVSKQYDWRKPGKNIRAMITFPVGEWTVTKEQGDEMVAAGVAEEIDKPKKSDAK